MKLSAGIALGGGGVRCLAHIPILEALDSIDLKPALITGTSMGAIIGALYASGMSGREIRKMILEHVILDNDGLRDVFEKKQNLLKWVSVFKANFSRGGLINARGYIEYLFKDIKAKKFEDLEIPLAIVAADFWTGGQVVFEKGPLLPALQASMAVPGIFSPVVLEGRVLVDGGVVNMVPYELLFKRVDFTIAVNVSRVRFPDKHQVPNAVESVMGTFEIMQTTVLAERLKHRMPDIYICPELRDIRLLDFGKIPDVLVQAQPAADHLRKTFTEKNETPAYKKRKRLLG